MIVWTTNFIIFWFVILCNIKCGLLANKIHIDCKMAPSHGHLQIIHLGYWFDAKRRAQYINNFIAFWKLIKQEAFPSYKKFYNFNISCF
jgi:hypothetical protein